MNLTSLFGAWDLMRVLRLLMGLLAAAQAIDLRDPLIGLIAAFFLYQAIANVSCCGVGGACRTPIKADAKHDKLDHTSYEEIK